MSSANKFQGQARAIDRQQTDDGFISERLFLAEADRNGRSTQRRNTS